MRRKLGLLLCLLLAGHLIWFSIAKQWWTEPVNHVHGLIHTVVGISEIAVAVCLLVPATRLAGLGVTAVAFAGAVVGTAIVLAAGLQDTSCQCLGHVRISTGIALLVQSGMGLAAGAGLLALLAERPRLDSV